MKRLLLVLALATASADLSAMNLSHPCNPCNPIGFFNPISPNYVGRRHSSGSSQHGESGCLIDAVKKDVSEHKEFYIAGAIACISLAGAFYMGMRKED